MNQSPELSTHQVEQVARQLAAKSPEDVKLTTVGEAANSVSLRAEANSRQVFIKLFRPGIVARQAYQREQTALAVFSGDLVPQILLADPETGFLITDFIQGRTLADSVTGQNLPQMAEFLGNWLGRLANLAPRLDHDGDWAGYLDRYESGFDKAVLADHAPFLSGQRIGQLVLARNDNALSNFVIAPDRRLYGVDFEFSRMKPEGWDLITAARAFLDMYPQEFDVIIASMLRGYHLTVMENGIGEAFENVIRVLVTANLLSNAASSP
ncbi:MAG: phosphotransferase [Rhodobacteraceae bacterium]|nr:phosphotransferase [Paracoccaceae bacterium]